MDLASTTQLDTWIDGLFQADTLDALLGLTPA